MTKEQFMKDIAKSLKASGFNVHNFGTANNMQVSIDKFQLTVKVSQIKKNGKNYFKPEVVLDSYNANLFSDEFKTKYSSTLFDACKSTFSTMASIQCWVKELCTDVKQTLNLHKYNLDIICEQSTIFWFGIFTSICQEDDLLDSWIDYIIFLEEIGWQPLRRLHDNDFTSISQADDQFDSWIEYIIFLEEIGCQPLRCLHDNNYQIRL